MDRLTHRAVGVRAALLFLAGALLVAGCGSSPAASGTGTPPTTARGTTATTEAPEPAAALPSEISKMVCSAKTRDEIDQVLGVSPDDEPAPTWVDHLYTCRWVYPKGVLTLSVKELSSWSQTYAYYDSFARTLQRTSSIGNLGQGAYTVRDGSVVVRKDWKVLLVNDTGLPPKFGVPATTRAEVAFTVADVILGCWAGD